MNAVVALDFLLAVWSRQMTIWIMNGTVSIGKAKPRLCDLVDQARKGQTHIITVRDQPAAQIGPVLQPARRLTDEWRRRVQSRDIRLNRPGQKKLGLDQLIRGGRE